MCQDFDIERVRLEESLKVAISNLLDFTQSEGFCIVMTNDRFAMVGTVETIKSSLEAVQSKT
jgi:hypothetical protein